MRTKLDNLQGLRGVACLLVLGVHAGGWESDFGVSREFLRPFRWFGFAGVDLFFVISGFIIAHTQAGSFGNIRAIPGYLFRRFWRVYPLFWITMLIAVPAIGAALSPTPFPDWFAWLTLTPSEFPNYYIAPAWTLTYEVTFYAAFGLLLALPRRWAPWALVAWGVAIVAVLSQQSEVPYYAATVGDTLFSPLILEFLLGCAVAAAVRHFPPCGGRFAVLAGIAWGVCWAVSFSVPGRPYAICTLPLERVWSFGPASALIVYGCIVAERQGTLTLPRWLRATGDASYSIYLWHGPIGMALHFSVLWWPHHTAPHLAWLAFMLSATWGGGMLLHRWVERPLLNLVKRRPKTPVPVIVEARVSLGGEGQHDELLVGILGDRSNPVDLEGPADAVPADVFQPLVDDELIFSGYPELGSRPELDTGLGRVDRHAH